VSLVLIQLSKELSHPDSLDHLSQVHLGFDFFSSLAECLAFSSTTSAETAANASKKALANVGVVVVLECHSLDCLFLL